MQLWEILSSLRDIARRVQEDLRFCREMQKDLSSLEGYANRFNDISGMIENEVYANVVKAQVMKVLAEAVNEAIHVKVDLISRPLDDQGLQFLELLHIDGSKSLRKYFNFEQGLPKLHQILPKARSPYDIAKYIKERAPQWLIENLIQYQFDIKWNTQNGEPCYYTFYQFCDQEGTAAAAAHFKYKPRLAHAKTALYQECRIRSVLRIRRVTKESLCPIVYIRTINGWASWQADDEDITSNVDIENDLSWIDPSIRKFITENADEQKELKDEDVASPLDKPTLYWAVLDDEEFYPHSKRENIGKTQVYVGKANNGVRGRWLKDKNNHCAMMKKCLDNVCDMTTYDPSILEGIQLVDVRLALAKVRSYAIKKPETPKKTALFVMKTFGDAVEKAELAQEKAQACLNKVRGDLERFATRSSRYGFVNTSGTSERINELKEKEETYREELDEAKAVADDLKDLNTSKAEAEPQLTQAEKWHRKGKRVQDQRKNIIPYKDYKVSWKPTDMKFGMNCN